MMETQLQPDMPIEPKYGSLKVLTILTFIGSALAIFSGIYQYFSAEKNLAAMEKLMNSPDILTFNFPYLSVFNISTPER